MAVAPALTSPEITALAGIGTVTRYLSPVPDAVVATALVNQATFTYPIFSLTVDTTSGGWGNIREGMTLYVGSTPGGRERGTYRVRKAGNSTTIYIGEMGSQDPGQMPMDLRSAGIANNDYVTVVERFDIWAVIPRIVVTSPTVAAIYEDYDKTVGTLNTTPPPIVNVAINGRQNHLATYISAATLAISASASVTKWPTSGASSLTYAWTVPAGWTSVSGAATATLTANAAPGNYVLRLTVTDSVGGATERVMVVNIHSAASNPPLTISDMPKSDNRDRGGRRMSFDLYDDHLTSLVDGAMVIYFEVATWNGTDVPTATRQCVGWVQRQQRDGEEGLRQANIDLVGPAGMLDKLGGTSQIIKSVASPANWQECVASLASATFMAWYMLKYRAANVLRLFDFNSFSVTATGQRKPEWIIDKGSLFQQMQSLATERGNFGANSDGSLFFLRHPSLVNYADRGTSVVTRDSLDASLYSSVSLTVEQRMNVQQVRGEAFSWDGSAALPTPYYADAPKAVGQGSNQAKLPSQVVTNQAELNQITGDQYARLNNPYSSFGVTILKNRDVFEPAEMPFVSVTIPAYLSPTDAAVTLKGVIANVSKRHNADGTSDIELTLEAETHGLAADYVAVPAGNTTVYVPPYVPSGTDTLPPLSVGDITIPSSVFPTDPISTAPSVVPGRAAIRNTDTAGYRTYDIRPSAPEWDDVGLPSWFTEISMMVMDDGKAFSRGAYILGNDGTDSRVAYTADVFETVPVWTLGATMTGIYTILKSVRGIPGAIYVYGSSSAASSTSTYDFTVDEQGWIVWPAAEYVAGVYAAGVGWKTAFGHEYLYDNRGVYIQRLGFNTVTSVEVDYNFTPGSNNGLPAYICITISDGSTPLANVVGPSGTGTLTWTGTSSTNSIVVQARTGYHDPFSGADPGGECIFTQIRITSSLLSYASRYSTDYGATFGAARAVDNVTGDPGFDASPRGIAALGGGDQRVRTALAGGTYTTTVNGGASASYPVSVCVPDYQIGSISKSNKPDDPNFLFAAPSIIASHCLWKVTLAGKVGITPSVSGSKALGAKPRGLDAWKGKRFMYIGDAAGTRYLFVTKDTGVTWTYTAMPLANSVRIRKYSANGYEAIAAASTNGLKYTSNGGVTWSTKTASGDNLFAQIFG